MKFDPKNSQTGQYLPLRAIAYAGNHMLSRVAVTLKNAKMDSKHLVPELFYFWDIESLFVRRYIRKGMRSNHEIRPKNFQTG